MSTISGHINKGQVSKMRELRETFALCSSGLWELVYPQMLEGLSENKDKRMEVSESNE